MHSKLKEEEYSPSCQLSAQFPHFILSIHSIIIVFVPVFVLHIPPLGPGKAHFLHHHFVQLFFLRFIFHSLFAAHPSHFDHSLAQSIGNDLERPFLWPYLSEAIINSRRRYNILKPKISSLIWSILILLSSLFFKYLHVFL